MKKITIAEIIGVLLAIALLVSYVWSLTMDQGYIQKWY